MKIYAANDGKLVTADSSVASVLNTLTDNCGILKQAFDLINVECPHLVLIGSDSTKEAAERLAEFFSHYPHTERAITKVILVTSVHLGSNSDYATLIGSGVDEILLVPMHQSAFDEKIRRDIAQVDAARKMRHQLENARIAALAAMTTASDLGRVLSFMDRCHGVQNLDHLATITLQMLDTFNLKATMLLRDQQTEHWASTYPVLPNIHKDFLGKIEQRILTHKQAISVRFDYCSILVTNAPQHDEDRMGQLRDLLAQIANVLESKVRQIMLFKLIESQHDYMVVVMGLINKSSSETKDYTASIMRTLVSNLESEAISLDLTEGQEQRIINLANQASETLDALLKGNNELEKHLNSLLDSLNMAKTLSTSTHYPSSNQSDIELF